MILGRYLYPMVGVVIVTSALYSTGALSGDSALGVFVGVTLFVMHDVGGCQHSGDHHSGDHHSGDEHSAGQQGGGAVAARPSEGETPQATMLSIPARGVSTSDNIATVNRAGYLAAGGPAPASLRDN